MENILRQHNEYIRTLRQAKEHIRHIPEAVITISPDRRPNGEHERRFNQQIANEVAVVIQTNNEPAITSRHIVITQRGGALGGWGTYAYRSQSAPEAPKFKMRRWQTRIQTNNVKRLLV